MNIKNKKNFYITLSLLLIFILSIFLLSYAYLKPKIGPRASTPVGITASCGHYTFLDGSDSINLTNTYPMSDNMGKKTTPYTFSVKNTCAVQSSFVIYLVVPSSSEIQNSYINYEFQPTNITGKLTDIEKNQLMPNLKTQIEALHSYEVKSVFELTTDTLEPGTTKTYDIKLWVNKLAPNSVMNKTFIASLAVIDKKDEYTFADKILDDNDGKEYIDNKTPPTFTAVEQDNMGMYAMDDDYTATTGNKSYYFRGAVDNNWVKFGKENGNDIWWRIVRINGDGSVKLIYTGTTGPQSSNESVIITGVGTQIKVDNKTTTAFNTSYDRGEYIGYMYEEEVHRGHEEDSTIKDFIDTWYEEHFLNTDYEEYLSDFVVCNDRGFPNNWEPIGLPTSGEGTQYSDVYGRLRTTNTPKLTCTDKEDRYTVDDTIIGNGELTYPIGLLTADEATLAGGYRAFANSSYYLYTNQNYWLVSPFSVNTSHAFEFNVFSSGTVYNYSVVNSGGARPAVSLSSDLSVSGSGQWNDPYVVE